MFIPSAVGGDVVLWFSHIQSQSLREGFISYHVSAYAEPTTAMNMSVKQNLSSIPHMLSAFIYHSQNIIKQ